jgi:hypothetical protein
MLVQQQHLLRHEKIAGLKAMKIDPRRRRPIMKIRALPTAEYNPFEAIKTSIDEGVKNSSCSKYRQSGRSDKPLWGHQALFRQAVCVGQ